MPMDIVFSKLQNKLHLKSCSHSGYSSLTHFSNPNNDDDFLFLYSLVFYFVSIENNPNIEICPYCLGEKYNLIFECALVQ